MREKPDVYIGMYNMRHASQSDIWLFGIVIIIRSLRSERYNRAMIRDYLGGGSGGLRVL